MIRNEKNYFNDMWALSVDMFQQLLHNPILDLQQKLHTARGVCGGDAIERRDVTLDFDMLSEIITFEEKGRFGR